MERPFADKTFVFSAPINGNYVIELYAGDYIMIEETFADVLREYDAFVQRILTTYHEGDVPALKSAVHKIKPLFGFVGLTALQSQCLHFENACLSATITQLADTFPALRSDLMGARAIIEKEKGRLTEYNSQS
jgi:HPt (histidine-containing phosphotransfer) domain-containing protein